MLSNQHVMWTPQTHHNSLERSNFKGVAWDSGAFSVWTKGKEVDIDKLISFYHAEKDRSDFLITLDVIEGTWQQNKENLRIMESAGLDVVPVYHGPDTEPYFWLDELREKYDFICLGTVCKRAASKRCVNWLHEVYTNHPHKYHGLKMVALVHLFPFVSVDSATWAIAAAMYNAPTNKGQQQANFLTKEELCELWIKYYTRIPKCTVYKNNTQQQTIF